MNRIIDRHRHNTRNTGPVPEPGHNCPGILPDGTLTSLPLPQLRTATRQVCRKVHRETTTEVSLSLSLFHACTLSHLSRTYTHVYTHTLPPPSPPPTTHTCIQSYLQDLLAYFDNTWALTESLFAGLQGPEAFYQVCITVYGVLR